MFGSATEAASASMPSLQHKHLERVKITDGYNSSSRVSPAGSKLSVTQRTLTDEQKKLHQRLSSPFSRQDIFYAGSVTSLREYKSSADMAAYVKVDYVYSKQLLMENKPHKVRKSRP